MRVGRNFVLGLLSCSVPGIHASATPLAIRLPGPLARDSHRHRPDLWAGEAFSSPPIPVFRRAALTPLLDRQLGDQRLGAVTIRRRDYRLDIGRMAFGVEMLRLQPVPGDRYAVRTADGPRKSWSLGIHGDWQMGTADRLSLGLANGHFRSSSGGPAVSDPQQLTSLHTLALDWTHDDHWRAGLGWQQSSGSSSRVQDRIVELARGDALHESGPRAALAYLPRGEADPFQSSFGIETHRAKLAADDSAALTSQSRQDTRAALFYRTRF